VLERDERKLSQAGRNPFPTTRLNTGLAQVSFDADQIAPMKIFVRIKRLVGYAASLARLNVRRLLRSKAPAPQSETPSEIEYYSLLADEVSKLPKNTHLARQALYDRRWVAVAARLQQLNHDQIASEQLAFQKALCKVEIEMAMYEVGDHAKQQPMRQEKRRPF